MPAKAGVQLAAARHCGFSGCDDRRYSDEGCHVSDTKERRQRYHPPPLHRRRLRCRPLGAVRPRFTSAVTAGDQGTRQATPAGPSSFIGTSGSRYPVFQRHLLRHEAARTFSGRQLSEIAFPLGGIGTGTVSLGGRGDLRDWEIFNRPNKGKALPFTFVALWAKPSRRAGVGEGGGVGPPAAVPRRARAIRASAHRACPASRARASAALTRLPRSRSRTRRSRSRSSLEAFNPVRARSTRTPRRCRWPSSAIAAQPRRACPSTSRSPSRS